MSSTTPARLLALILSALLTFGAMSALTAPAAQAADKDCGDFKTQKGAQDFFLNAGGPQKDPHGLDADGDGVACESLPCPCSTSQGGGGGGGGSTPPQDDPKPKQVIQFGKVTKVIDGDTLDVKLRSKKKERVRVIGIDTPEVYGGTECMGPEASANAKKLFPKDTKVKLFSDTTQDLKDKYDRILRYVQRIKGKKDLGKLQLKAGLARVYVYDKTPFKRVKDYRKAEKSAKNKDLGIWGEC